MSKEDEYKEKIKQWRKLAGRFGTSGGYESGKEIEFTKFDPEKNKELNRLSKDLLDNYEEFLNPTDKYEIREIINFFN